MPNPKALILCLLLALAPAAAERPAQSQRSEGENGLAGERLARLDKVMQQHVDENRIGGAVVLVLRDGAPSTTKPSVGATRKRGGG